MDHRRDMKIKDKGRQREETGRLNGNGFPALPGDKATTRSPWIAAEPNGQPQSFNLPKLLMQIEDLREAPLYTKILYVTRAFLRVVAHARDVRDMRRGMIEV